MSLSYKNLAFDELVTNYRDLRYANGALNFGYANSVNQLLTLQLDVTHLGMQADVFTQGMDKFRSKLMLKKYISARPSEWSQMLHEAYVYDRLRCIYYGLTFNSLVKLPENISAFPGNVLLMHFLSRGVFKFEQNDEQPFSLTISIEAVRSFETLVKPILDKYPNLKVGLSDYSNTSYFYNSNYERILTGLSNDREYLIGRRPGNGGNNNNNNNSNNIFEITKLTDDRIMSFLNKDSNPIANSFLSKELNKFLFNMPYDKSGPQALRFNESLFLPRAVGLTGNNISYEGNPFYKSVPRRISKDIMAKEEVYAVTGLKCSVVPQSSSEMNFYLKVVNLIDQMIDGVTNEDDSEDTSP